MSASVLRVGIAGLGFGQAVLLPVFTALPGVEVVALLARRPEKAAGVAARFAVPAIASDLEAFLDRGLDAVALALPPAAGAACAEAALARGLAVLCEKPMAATLDEARRLAALADGRTATVDFTFSELDAFQTVRRFLLEGRYGAVRAVAVTWLTESRAHRNRLWGWKLDAEHCGGVMTHQGSHVLYLLEWLFGRVRLEHAVLDRRATAAIAPAGGRPAEDTAALALRLAGGAPVSVMLSNAAPGGDGLHRWEIACDRARLVLVRQGPGVMNGFSLRVGDGETDRLKEVVPAGPDTGAGGRLDPFRRLAERFVAAARAGRDCPPDFNTGLRVQELMARAAVQGGL